MFKVTEQNRKWWILMAMTTSISMIFIDVTVLPVTLPTIQRELNTSEIALQWLINAYLLSLTIFLLAGGRIGDMFGYRRIFCAGLLVFSIASALCGLSPSTAWFITARALQGVGGALLLPNTYAILFSSFPQNQRGKAIGIYVSIGAIFLALGPFIGGVLTEYVSWRAVFWINLPIALVGLILTLAIVPLFRPKKESFDYLGFFTLAIGVSSLIVAIMQEPNWGWLSIPFFALLFLGISLIALLIIADRKVQHPFIDFSIFKNRLFVGANINIFLTQFLLMVTVFWPIYFQTILLYSPAQAGMIALFANAPVLFGAPLGGFLTDRLGPKPCVIMGFCLIALSLLWFSFHLNTHNLWSLVCALIPFGIGVSFIFTPSSVASLSQVPDHKRGIAGAINSTLRQFGSTLGMAIFGALFLQVRTESFKTLLQANPSTSKLELNQFEGLLAKSTEAQNALKTLPHTVAGFVQSSMAESFKVAFSQINILAACIGILGLICSIFLLKKHFSS